MVCMVWIRFGHLCPPMYIVVVSNPAEIIVDEDASEIILPLRGYIAAKAYKSRVVATISPTEGIRVDKDNRRESVLASIHARLSRVTKCTPK